MQTDEEKLAKAQEIVDANKENPKVREMFEKYALEAAMTIGNLATIGSTENVRLAAARDVLDRSGYSPITRTQSQVDITSKGQQINALPSPEEFDEILKAYVSRKRPDTVIEGNISG